MNRHNQKRHRIMFISLSLVIATLVPALALVHLASLEPQAGPGQNPPGFDPALAVDWTTAKSLDQNNVKNFQQSQERQRRMNDGGVSGANAPALAANDRVLVILVEYAGTDTFTWKAPTSPFYTR